MKKNLFIPLLVGIALTALTLRVSAQTPGALETSPSETTGEVTGVLVNRSPDGTIPQSLSVMLHILDQNYNQVGMLHTLSQPDGSFRFEDVPLDQNELYAGIVSYQGATYYSEPVPYDGENAPNLDLPVYETTTDLAKVQIDEMHVLFNFAQDGLEVSEIYLISNLDDYTITRTLTLTDGQPATIEFPLPEKADYVFFKPDASDRFVRLDNGFADKAPLVPGERSSNMMVSYLLPYAETMSYSYTAPVPVVNIDYLLPAEQGVSLNGPGLTGPQTTTLQDKSVYQVYSYKALTKGQTVQLNFSGKPNIQPSSTNPSAKNPIVSDKNSAIEIASGALGLAMMGIGIWQWRKSKHEEADEVSEEVSDELTLNQLATKIAQLDDTHEKGMVDEENYQAQRADLLKQAKSVIKRVEK